MNMEGRSILGEVSEWIGEVVAEVFIEVIGAILEGIGSGL